MYCLYGFYPLLNDKRISQLPFYFSQRPSTSVHISSASYHIQHQIADASQLKMRANRFQLLQLKPGEVYLLFDRFEPDFNPPATLIHQNRRRRLHLDVIAHQDDGFILYSFVVQFTHNQHYRADYRVFGHNTVVAILHPKRPLCFIWERETASRIAPAFCVWSSSEKVMFDETLVTNLSPASLTAPISACER